MKPLSLATAVLLSIAVPAAAYGDQPMSAAGRQAQIERVRDGLNSPDPTKRLVTLETALASKDRNLRRVALSTAFASSDSDLRSAALIAATSSAAVLVVDITAGDPSNATHLISSKIGSSFELRIRHFDHSRNTFETSSSSSGDNNTTIWMTGGLSGDRLSFEVNTGKIFKYNPSLCRGVARLEGGTSVLKGTMNCVMVWCTPMCADLAENYTIAIDVPK